VACGTATRDRDAPGRAPWRACGTRARIVAALLACAAVPSAVANPADDAAAIAKLRQEIAEAVGDAGCVINGFCRVYPVGMDACGNPTGWLASNNLPGIREVVETKAAEITFIEEDALRGKPRGTDCKPVAAPKPACVNSRCIVSPVAY
jgi:hypothetical protein